MTKVVLRYLPWLAGFGVILTLGVMGLGAFTRLVDAGLGCPDWPGCYGHWFVSKISPTVAPAIVSYKAWAEMIHRYMAGTLASLTMLVFLSLVWLSFNKQAFNHSFNNLAKFAGILAISLWLLIMYQILLGRWTVTLQLLPIVVTQHLLGAQGIAGLLWITLLLSMKVTPAVRLNSIDPTSLNKATWLSKGLPWLGLGLLLVQIFLGAWTSTHYAALSCEGFPFCTNEGIGFPTHFKEAFHVSMIPANYEGGLLSSAVRQTIHMTHRLGALVVSVYLLGMSLFFIRKGNVWLKNISVGIMGLVLLQITLGIANVLFQLPLAIAIAHNITATLLFLTLITLCFGMTVWLK